MMKVRLARLVLISAVAVGSLQGCNACCRRPDFAASFPPDCNRPQLLAPRPLGPGPTCPPAPVPSGTYLPPTQVGPGDVRSYPPRSTVPVEPSWQPSPEPGARLLNPEAGPSERQRDSARLSPPQA